MTEPALSLVVVVAWSDAAPARRELRELGQELGTKPHLVRLSPRSATWLRSLRRLWHLFRRALAAAARRTGSVLVKVRGGARVARLLVAVTAVRARPPGPQNAVSVLRYALPRSGPVLLVFTDARSARTGREAIGAYGEVLAVLGLGAAARTGRAVLDSGLPWYRWREVLSDVDATHLYAALPRQHDGLAPAFDGRPQRATVVRPPNHVPGKQTALLIAPANYAGQGTAWAQSVERHLGVRAENLHVVKADSPYTYAADHPVTTAEWQRVGVRERIAREAVGPATHVLLETMRPVFDVDGTAVSSADPAAGLRDVRALLSSARRVGLLIHGSEGRRPALHATIYPHSPFADRLDDPYVEVLSGVCEKVHGCLDEVPSLPRFVSTPDMLDFVPGARWLPVVVRPGSFVPGVPVLERPVPVVLHAPSNPVLKGSDLVDSVLGELHDEGLIEYRRLRDVPPYLVQDHVRDVDVVVDQIALGNVGVLALESMACGRVVLGHAIPQAMDRYGEPVPMVRVSPVSLEDKIREVVQQRDAYRDVAAAAPDFVRRHHDGRRSADALREFLGVPLSS